VIDYGGSVKMPKPGWRATVVREDLYEEVEQLIKPNEELPKSVAEFVNMAVREKLDRIKHKGEGKGG
ncbi:MAG: hypothetical protein QXU75_08305, partial [Candidatus Methanomethylicaceae archaeon]